MTAVLAASALTSAILTWAIPLAVASLVLAFVVMVLRRRKEGQ